MINFITFLSLFAYFSYVIHLSMLSLGRGWPGGGGGLEYKKGGDARREF